MFSASSMSQCGLAPPREPTALVFEDRHYSLAQLNALADGLAASLGGRGVTAGAAGGVDGVQPARVRRRAARDLAAGRDASC